MVKRSYGAEWALAGLIMLSLSMAWANQHGWSVHALLFPLLFMTWVKGIIISEYFMGLHAVRWRFRWIPVVWLSFVLGTVAYLNDA